LILVCDEEIGSYYRNLYWLAHLRGDKLLRPAFREHITVIRGEEPPDDKKHLWWKYKGETVQFTCSTVAGTNGDYFWLDAYCPRLLDIREELGLPRDPKWPLHLSIGHRGLSDV
jgi:hypothetical protein